MVATLTFNLPEEQEEFQIAVDGQKLRSILFRLDNDLRSIVKYNSEEHGYSEDYLKAVEDIRAKIYQELLDENLSLY